jgi:uncharacterized SAM-dependent methyltransferase
VLSFLGDAALFLLFDDIGSFLLTKFEREELIFYFLLDILEEVKGGDVLLLGVDIADILGRLLGNAYDFRLENHVEI